MMGKVHKTFMRMVSMCLAVLLVISGMSAPVLNTCHKAFAQGPGFMPENPAGSPDNQETKPAYGVDGVDDGAVYQETKPAYGVDDGAVYQETKPAYDLEEDPGQVSEEETETPVENPTEAAIDTGRECGELLHEKNLSGKLYTWYRVENEKQLKNLWSSYLESGPSDWDGESIPIRLMATIKGDRYFIQAPDGDSDLEPVLSLDSLYGCWESDGLGASYVNKTIVTRGNAGAFFLEHGLKDKVGVKGNRITQDYALTLGRYDEYSDIYAPSEKSLFCLTDRIDDNPDTAGDARMGFGDPLLGQTNQLSTWCIQGTGNHLFKITSSWFVTDNLEDVEWQYHYEAALGISKDLSGWKLADTETEFRMKLLRNRWSDWQTVFPGRTDYNKDLLNYEYGLEIWYGVPGLDRALIKEIEEEAPVEHQAQLVNSNGLSGPIPEGSYYGPPGNNSSGSGSDPYSTGETKPAYDTGETKPAYDSGETKPAYNTGESKPAYDYSRESISSPYNDDGFREEDSDDGFVEDEYQEDYYEDNLDEDTLDEEDLTGEDQDDIDFIQGDLNEDTLDQENLTGEDQDNPDLVPGNLDEDTQDNGDRSQSVPAEGYLPTVDLTGKGLKVSQGKVMSLSSHSIYYLRPGHELVIETGGVLILERGCYLINNGNIVNDGQIIIQPGGGILEYDGPQVGVKGKKLDYQAGAITGRGDLVIREGGKVKLNALSLKGDILNSGFMAVSSLMTRSDHDRGLTLKHGCLYAGHRLTMVDFFAGEQADMMEAANMYQFLEDKMMNQEPGYFEDLKQVVFYGRKYLYYGRS